MVTCATALQLQNCFINDTYCYNFIFDRYITYNNVTRLLLHTYLPHNIQFKPWPIMYRIIAIEL